MTPDFLLSLCLISSALALTCGTVWYRRFSERQAWRVWAVYFRWVKGMR